VIAKNPAPAPTICPGQHSARHDESGQHGGDDHRRYFDHEDDARAMLRRMLNTVPPKLSDSAKVTAIRRR
jgi:hypothetical protein